MKNSTWIRVLRLGGVLLIFCYLGLTCGDYGPSLPAPNQPRQPGPPAATTTSSGGVTQTAATVNGTVNPTGAATSYYFQYGTTTSYGSQTTTASAGSGFGPVNVSANLSGLTPNTTYHYRVVATNSNGTSNGADMTFTTGAPPATYKVSLTGVSAVGDTSGQTATVSGLPIAGPEVPVQ